MLPKHWNCESIWFDRSHMCDTVDFILWIAGTLILVIIIGALTQRDKK